MFSKVKRIKYVVHIILLCTLLTSKTNRLDVSLPHKPCVSNRRKSFFNAMRARKGLRHSGFSDTNMSSAIRSIAWVIYMFSIFIFKTALNKVFQPDDFRKNSFINLLIIIETLTIRDQFQTAVKSWKPIHLEKSSFENAVWIAFESTHRCLH